MTATPLLLALALQQAPAPAPTAQVVTLDDAVRLARENAPALRAARAGVDAAEARSWQSLAPLLPQVSGTATWRRAGAEATGLLPGDVGNDLSLGATASQTLFDFPAFARYRASRASARAEADTARAAEQDAVLAARNAFFQARASKELVGVARATLENQEGHFRKVDAYVQQGMRPPIDLAQARADRANAKAQLVSRENGYATARVRLNLAMGVAGSADYEVSGEPFPPVEGEDLPLETLLKEALAARPDVAAFEGQIAAGEGAIWAARGGWLPRLGLAATAGDAGPDAGPLAWSASIGATLSWSPFQGGLTRAQVAEARPTLDARRARRDLLVLQTSADLDAARLDVRAAIALLDADREAVEASRERMRLADARYSSGAGSSLELSDAQLALTSAEAQRVQAEFQLAQARAALLSALGRR
jgi:outer membrane protein